MLALTFPSYFIHKGDIMNSPTSPESTCEMRRQELADAIGYLLALAWMDETKKAGNNATESSSTSSGHKFNPSAKRFVTRAPPP